MRQFILGGLITAGAVFLILSATAKTREELNERCSAALDKFIAKIMSSEEESYAYWTYVCTRSGQAPDKCVVGDEEIREDLNRRFLQCMGEKTL